jgi:hypothetical protein
MAACPRSLFLNIACKKMIANVPKRVKKKTYISPERLKTLPKIIIASK